MVIYKLIVPHLVVLGRGHILNVTKNCAVATMRIAPTQVVLMEKFRAALVIVVLIIYVYTGRKTL